jgi:DNA-directed RNA polymerase subunit RPC12/RpoP
LTELAKCPICGLVYVTQTNVDRQMAKKESKEEGSNSSHIYFCPHGDRAFPTEQQQEQSALRCQFCSIELLSSDELRAI